MTTHELDHELERDDAGRPILEPYDVEPVHDTLGNRIGWRIPDHERERWNSTRWSSDSPHAPEPPAAKPLPDILQLLEALIFLTDQIKTDLTDAYHENPLQTWQLTEDINRRRDHLTNPAGVLIKGLRQILRDK